MFATVRGVRSGPGAHNPGELIGYAQRLDDLAHRYRDLDEPLALALEEVAQGIRGYLAAIGRSPGSARRRI
jgi:hypothetical protein